MKKKVDEKTKSTLELADQPESNAVEFEIADQPEPNAAEFEIADQPELNATEFEIADQPELKTAENEPTSEAVEQSASPIEESAQAKTTENGASYGAPQTLYEDIIPQSVLAEKRKKNAAVAEEKKAKAEKKKEEKPTKPAKEKPTKPAKEKPTKPAKEKAQKVQKDKEKEKLEKAVTHQVYNKEIKKLRKKYKIEQDDLLSDHQVLPGFILAKDEQLVRTYNCLESRKGDGTITLTNKRLLINAGERSEVAVENVSGIKFSRFTKFYFVKFLFSLIFLIIGIAAILFPFLKDKLTFLPELTWYKNWFEYLFIAGGAVFLFIGLILLFKTCKKTFYFYVYAKEDAPFLDCKNAVMVKREKKGKVVKSIVASAGKESDKAARELGALIIEVKEGRYND